MPFDRFVEIGRVGLVNYGPNLGKLAVIIDVLDQNRVLVHGPTTGVQRQVISLKRLALTPIKLKIGRGSRTKALVKAIKEQDMEGKWAKTAWARKLALRQKRASATDFDRFKLMVARRTRARLANAEFRKLRASTQKKAKK